MGVMGGVTRFAVQFVGDRRSAASSGRFSHLGSASEVDLGYGVLEIHMKVGI